MSDELSITLAALRDEHRQKPQFEVYGVYGGKRKFGGERIIARRLTWHSATSLAIRLQIRHDERYPNRSCWDKRCYSARLPREARKEAA